MYSVLIIDDEEFSREGLIEFIPWENFGFKVVGEASDGLEGVALAKKLQPNLAICDIRMPKLSGLQMIEKIKDEVDDCFFIILSGYSDKDYFHSAIELNVCAYIEKPLEIEKFMRALKDVATKIERQKQQRMENEKLKHRVMKSHQLIYNTMLDMLVGKIRFDEGDLNKWLTNQPSPFLQWSGYQVLRIISDSSEAYQMLEKRCATLCESQQVFYLSQITDEGLLLIFEAKNNKWLELLELVLKEISTDTNIRFKGAVGRSVKEIDQIVLSYEDTVSMLKTMPYSYHLHTYSGSTGLDIIDTVKRLIQENPKKDLSNTELSSHVYVTPQYMCALFSEETGMTITEYKTQIRMEKAKELMLDSRLKLYEIADILGYDNAKYFSKVFKKYTNQTPREYRKSHGAVE